jgi:hypothetical protein
VFICRYEAQHSSADTQLSLCITIQILERQCCDYREEITGNATRSYSSYHATQNIAPPALKEIGLKIPEETGVLQELQRSPMRQMQVARELAEKRRLRQEKGAQS